MGFSKFVGFLLIRVFKLFQIRDVWLPISSFFAPSLWISYTSYLHQLPSYSFAKHTTSPALHLGASKSQPYAVSALDKTRLCDHLLIHYEFSLDVWSRVFSMFNHPNVRFHNWSEVLSWLDYHPVSFGFSSNSLSHMEATKQYSP
ncbi:Uncharacterized protein Rs2_35376 [Raphanus sativus]|nr:Uncharacterized protein Rs2_35376 [Raphanus sativus]